MQVCMSLTPPCLPICAQLGFVAAYIVLNMIACKMNREHKHRQSSEKAVSKLSFISKYFDCNGFFAWEEKRQDDVDHTLDTKLDNITKKLATLAEVVAKIPGVSVEALETLTTETQETKTKALPFERGSSGRGPVGMSQRVKVAPLQAPPLVTGMAPAAVCKPLESLSTASDLPKH